MAGPAVARHVERHEDRFFTGCLAAFGIQLLAVACGLLVTWLLMRWA